MSVEAPTSDSSMFDQADTLHSECEYRQVYDLLLTKKNEEEKLDQKELAQVFWRLARVCSDLAMNGDTSKASAAEQEAVVNEGLRYAKRSVECDPDVGQTHKWLAILTSKSNNFMGNKAKLEGSVVIREHIAKAIERDPTDGVSEFVFGQWCFSFADMGWATRKLASSLFAAVPTSTYEEALQHFLRADEIDPGFHKMNSLMIFKCHKAMRASSKVQREAAEAVLLARPITGQQTAQDGECDATAKKFLGRK